MIYTNSARHSGPFNAAYVLAEANGDLALAEKTSRESLAILDSQTGELGHARVHPGEGKDSRSSGRLSQGRVEQPWSHRDWPAFMASFSRSRASGKTPCGYTNSRCIRGTRPHPIGLWASISRPRRSRGCGDVGPMLPAKIRRLHPCFMLLHYPDDLLFRVSALLHPSPPVQITRELQFSMDEFSGSRSLQL